MKRDGKLRDEHKTAGDSIDVARARLVRRGPGRPVSLSLKTLREAAGKTQAQVAKASGLVQPEISKLEAASSFDDRMVSTLRRYLLALGNELELVAVSKHKHRITVSESAAGGASGHEFDGSPQKSNASCPIFISSDDCRVSDKHEGKKQMTIPIIERDPLEGFAFAIFGNLTVLGKLEHDMQGKLIAIDPAFEFLRIQARDQRGNVVDFLSNVLPLFGYPHWTRLELHHSSLAGWTPSLVHSLDGLSPKARSDLAKQVSMCQSASQAMRAQESGVALVTSIPKVDPRRIKLP